MALDFDGNDDKITIPADASLQTAGAYTYCFWLYVNNAYHDDENGIFSHADSLAGYPGITLSVNGTGSGHTYCIGSEDGAGWDNFIDIGNKTTIAVGAWIHVAITNDGSSLKLRLNASEVGTDNSSTYIDWDAVGWSDKNLYMGTRRAGEGLYDSYCDCKIHDFMLIHEALSPDRIRELMNRRAISWSLVKGLWRFDEGALNLAPGGKDVADISGNGNHGDESGTMTNGDYVSGAPIEWNQGDQ